jgi:hypothetical protein
MIIVGVFPEGAIDGVANAKVGVHRLLQLGQVSGLAAVQRASDLIDVVADATEFTEQLPQHSMIGGRATLGARASTAQGGGPHECSGGKTGTGGERFQLGALLGGQSHSDRDASLAFVRSARHPPSDQ